MDYLEKKTERCSITPIGRNYEYHLDCYNYVIVHNPYRFDIQLNLQDNNATALTVSRYFFQT